jgi:predicted nucleic acid-binding protein
MQDTTLDIRDAIEGTFAPERSRGRAAGDQERSPEVAHEHRDAFSAVPRSKAMYGFSYRNAAIVAAAQPLGCKELLSEDVTHG